jgi:TPR repeat protein
MRNVEGKIMKQAVATLLLCLLGISCTASGKLQLQADQGNANAQYNLGEMYAKGDGVPQDKVKAARWFLKAAEQGHAGAQTNLGWIYVNGGGVVPKDSAEAMRWFRKAAAQGYAGGLYSVGTMYHLGEGMLNDNVEGLKWIRMAAETGDDPDYMKALSLMYSEGEGTPVDYVEALKWMILATVNNPLVADKEKELRDLEKSFIAATMTPDMIEQARKRAREWRPIPYSAAYSIASEAAQQTRPDMTSMNKPSTQLMAECISRIQARLLEIHKYHPQLSDIQMATVSPSTLGYSKGTVSWPDGELGAPRFSDPDGCQLMISLAHPAPPKQSKGTMVQGTYFPQVELNVDVLFVCTGRDAGALQQAVQAIVKEETIWLVVGLDLKKTMRPLDKRPLTNPHLPPMR